MTDTALDRFPFLASDLDGTLIPPAGSEVGRVGLERFAVFVTRHDPGLAYVTGRHLSLALRGVVAHGLPRPEAIAADVGTTLYWDVDGDWVPDETYREVVAATPGVIGHDEVVRALQGVGRLDLQGPDRQADFKTSYFVAPGALDDVSGEVASALADVGRARLVRSRDALSDRGLLDVLPEGVGKATALLHLRRSLDLAEDHIVYAGDSGNDVDAWLTGSPAIVVANTPPGLRDEVREEAARRGWAERLYLARHPFAAGVVEGMEHFGARG